MRRCWVLAFVLVGCTDAEGTVLRALGADAAPSDAAADVLTVDSGDAGDGGASVASVRLASLASDVTNPVDLCIAPADSGTFTRTFLNGVPHFAVSEWRSVAAPGGYDLRVVDAASPGCVTPLVELKNQFLGSASAETAAFIGAAGDGGPPVHPLELRMYVDDLAPTTVTLRPLNADVATNIAKIDVSDTTDAGMIDIATFGGFGSLAPDAGPNGYFALSPGEHAFTLLITSGPTNYHPLDPLDMHVGPYSLFAVYDDSQGTLGLLCDDTAMDAGLSQCALK